LRFISITAGSLFFGLFVGCVLADIFDVLAEAMKAIGRQANFTGRTPVWKALTTMAPNPIVGAGFETFWIGPRVAYLGHLFRAINEAHNGYLEVYLNLGWLGVGLIALILMQGYRRAVGAFRRGRDPTFGSLLVAYIVTAVTYSITEAGFRMLSVSWFFLLLSVIATGLVTVRHSHAKNSPPNLGGGRLRDRSDSENITETVQSFAPNGSRRVLQGDGSGLGS
jgi:O-antigen ligase